MSKSLKRVIATLTAAGQEASVIEMSNETRTAAAAAREVGCTIDQIAKSIVFRGETTSRAFLFVTAGGNQVDGAKAEALAGEQLGRADAAFVRAETGFAIGGVSPIGHIGEITTFFDSTLSKFDVIYAAAGTPHHIFPIKPQELQKIISTQASDFV